jgi:sigma-B regulation protein RsbU (phosphoserine phosphatase)
MGERMSILVVDDNKVNLFVIETILKQAGYKKIALAKSANEMIHILEEDLSINHGRSSYNLILLDIMMPEIDGIEACKRIMATEEYKDIPVIFVTALGDTRKLAEALDAGGSDYLMKPINKVELLARIRAALRLKEEKDWHKNQDEKISYELDLATKVQRSLLSEPILNEQIKITRSYKPSFNLAGDMYYWQQIDQDRYAIFMFDMMGHGIPASLVCMYISSILREAVRNLVDPEKVILELNRCMILLEEKTKLTSYYLTGIYLLVDTKSKTIEYVNAGHPPGYLYIDGKDVIEMGQRNTAVGFFNEMHVNKVTVPYTEGFQALLFTDGVAEAIDDDENIALAHLNKIAKHAWTEQEAMAPLNTILPEEKQANQHDDMCVILVRG